MEGNFEGGNVSGDGGLVLLWQVDRWIGLTKALAKRLPDKRDRPSCHAWWANQFRLLLSSAAYVLLAALRRVGLRGTEWARAQVGTIRLRLLKIGAVITRNTRRIRLRLKSSFPLQQLFCSLPGPLLVLALQSGAGPGTRKIMAA